MAPKTLRHPTEARTLAEEEPHAESAPETNPRIRTRQPQVAGHADRDRFPDEGGRAAQLPSGDRG